MIPHVPHYYHTLEIATAQNFDEKRYLAANPDLQDTKRKNKEFDIRWHFRNYGSKERRMQCVVRKSNRMGDKFRHFMPVLKLAQSRFMMETGTFPIVYGTTHPEVADYDGGLMNPIIPEWMTLLRSDPQGHYLDLGCIFRNIVYDNCLYVDVYLSHTVDVVIAPGSPLPIQDRSLDGLGCFTALEHIGDPFYVTHEIRRVVRPGGRIFIDRPFL